MCQANPVNLRTDRHHTSDRCGGTLPLGRSEPQSGCFDRPSVLADAVARRLFVRHVQNVGFQTRAKTRNPASKKLCRRYTDSAEILH